MSAVLLRFPLYASEREWNQVFITKKKTNKKTNKKTRKVVFDPFPRDKEILFWQWWDQLPTEIVRLCCVWFFCQAVLLAVNVTGAASVHSIRRNYYLSTLQNPVILSRWTWDLFYSNFFFCPSSCPSSWGKKNTKRGHVNFQHNFPKWMEQPSSPLVSKNQPDHLSWWLQKFAKGSLLKLSARIPLLTR